MSIESRMAHAVMATAIGASAFGLSACTRGNDVDTSLSDAANSIRPREVATVGFVGMGPVGPWRAADESRSATAAVLKANNNAVPFIVAQNDEMGLGAALAVEDVRLHHSRRT